MFTEWEYRCIGSNINGSDDNTLYSESMTISMKKADQDRTRILKLKRIASTHVWMRHKQLTATMKVVPCLMSSLAAIEPRLRSWTQKEILERVRC